MNYLSTLKSLHQTVASLCIFQCSFELEYFAAIVQPQAGQDIFLYLLIFHIAVSRILFIVWKNSWCRNDSQKIHAMIDLALIVNQCYLHYFHLYDDLMILSSETKLHASSLEPYNPFFFSLPLSFLIFLNIFSFLLFWIPCLI